MGEVIPAVHDGGTSQLLSFFGLLAVFSGCRITTSECYISV